MTGKPAEKGPIVAFSMPNVLLQKALRMLSYRLFGLQIGVGCQEPHSGGASLRDSRSMYPENTRLYLGPRDCVPFRQRAGHFSSS
jgi:hypothetical protein